MNFYQVTFVTGIVLYNLARYRFIYEKPRRHPKTRDKGILVLKYTENNLPNFVSDILYI